jgi:pyruvate dehydrogenase E1 component alpha subunit
MAMNFQDDEKVTVGFTGDGSTSQGDFYEAINFAGALDAHSVFIVQNNRYAISMPVERQTDAETLAQKAIAAGIEGVQADGNDVLAVHRAVSDAVEKAREGNPVVVELLTYRIEDHTTSDDSTRYRDEEEVEEWKEHDPLRRFREYLKDQDMWSDELEEFEEEAEERIDEAASDAMEIDDPPVEDMFDYVYGEMPDELQEQREEWVNRE